MRVTHSRIWQSMPGMSGREGFPDIRFPIWAADILRHAVLSHHFQ